MSDHVLFRPALAFGPRVPNWGSWDWIGADTRGSLESAFDTCEFRPWEAVAAEVVIVVKHRPPDPWIGRAARQARLIYAPVDAYNSSVNIDADSSWLCRCARIVVHCEGLLKYFAPYRK